MTALTQSNDVCVIGLGNMGSALAEALLANDQSVIVWNRTPSKCDALSTAGAAVAESVADAAAAAKVTVICVTDHQAGMSLLQADGVVGSLRGKLLVQLSIVTGEESRELGRWAEENGITYLDGSILGYPQNVRSNNCPIVYSGPKTAFDTNKAILTAIGGSPRFVSQVVGSVPTFDKTIHAFHYGSMIAFFHGAAMCHAAGFPIDVYADLVLGDVGEITNAAQRRYGEMIAARSYDAAEVTMEIDAAAYDYVVTLSEELGVDGKFPKTVADCFGRAIADGHGQQELPAVFELLVPRNA